MRVGIGGEGVRREASLGFEAGEIRHIGGIAKARCMKIVVEVQGVPVSGRCSAGLGLAWVSIAVRVERIEVVAAAIAIAIAKTLRVVGWHTECGIPVQGVQGCRLFVVTEVVVAVQAGLGIQRELALAMPIEYSR